MEYNLVSTGIELLGTTIKNLHIDNQIIDLDDGEKRSLGLNINKPIFEESDNELMAAMDIDFEIEIAQSDEQVCKIEFSIEGAFVAENGIKKEHFEKLVIVNGAAALIGIARGKMESITGSIFNSGKVVIPFVNVIDYYKSIAE